MRERRIRAVGALVVVATVALALVFTETPASAATVVYSCTGATNDVAASQTVLFTTTNYTSAQLLATLSQSIPYFPAQPQLSVVITAGAPASVPAGSGAFASSFFVSATLPSSLVTAASGFGLSQITVKDANFGIRAVGANPATFSDGFASKTIALSPSPVTVTQQINGSTAPAVPAGQAVTFKPGNARVSVVLNVRVDLLLLDVKTVTLNCTASDANLAVTAVTGSSVTTVPPTAAPTTAAPVSAPPVTAPPVASGPPSVAVEAAVIERAAAARFLAAIAALKAKGCRLKTVKVAIGRGRHRHVIKKQVLVCPKAKKVAATKRRR